MIFDFHVFFPDALWREKVACFKQCFLLFLSSLVQSPRRKKEESLSRPEEALTRLAVIAL